MGMNVTVRYDTPTGKRNVKVTNFKALGDIIVNQAVMRAQTAVVEMAGAAVAAETVIKISRFLRCVAIVFQRLVARTPLDEDYEMANGEIHRADSNAMRDDWVCDISIGGKSISITPKEFPSGIFSVVNDKESIRAVAKAIIGKAGKLNVRVSETTVSSDLGVVFRNNNDHFNKLEYGGSDKTSGHEPYKGKEREHGLIEGLSVQAPSGFFRLTMLELQDVMKSDAKSRTVQNRLYHHLYSKTKGKTSIGKKINQMEIGGISVKDLGLSPKKAFKENFNRIFDMALADSEAKKMFEDIEAEELGKLNLKLATANEQMKHYAGLPVSSAQQRKYREFEKRASELKKEISERNAGKNERWIEYRDSSVKWRKNAGKPKAAASKRKALEYKSPGRAARRKSRRVRLWREENKSRARALYGTQLLLPPPIKKNGRSAGKRK